ncbi:MAG: type 1 glutamine amidotransferase [Gammaproteobacteria bacterium]|nr:type 1 glutamine amidotransferase [Gammaproteobacteria bacterium]
MKPVLISRHVENEGPGYLADFLDHRGIRWQLVGVDQGESLPTSIADYSGFVFMGGTMSVNDNLPWINRALDLIRQAHDAGLPVLGHCLGGQLIAKAMGAEVRKNPVPEFGWHAVQTLPNPVTAPWLGACTGEIDAFHWHGETFDLPAGSQLLLTNNHCHNQGFVLDTMLALQCHIEMTPGLIESWIASSGNELPRPSASVQSSDAMRENMGQHLSNMRRLADAMYTHWVSLLS